MIMTPNDTAQLLIQALPYDFRENNLLFNAHVVVTATVK